MVAGMQPGRRTIRVRVTDGNGRATVETLSIRVREGAPRLLAVRLPRRLRTGAREVTIQISSTVSATLTVRGRRFQVGPALRRVAVPIQSGRGMLTLPMRLSAEERRPD